MQSESAHTTYYSLSQVFQFQNEDEKKWWHSTAPLLGLMMNNCRYDIHLQYKYLCLHREFVIPSLGPYPRPDFPRWGSTLTRHGLPYELSLNCSQSLVRLTWEPITSLTGTTADPFNTQAIWDVVRKLERQFPNVDLELFIHFTRELVTSEEEAACLWEKNADTGAFKTQNKLAFDLKTDGSEVLVKTYIYPQIKSLATGISVHNLIFNAIRKLDTQLPQLSRQLSMLEEYLTSRSESLFTFFLSFDLVVPSKSRLKVYAADTQVTLQRVEDIWTLGGRRSNSEAATGFHYLKELWQLLQIPEGCRKVPTDFYELGEDRPNEELPMLVNFTLSPRGDNHPPEPQIYFPVIGMNDMHVADALTRFFGHVGWEHMARSYKKDLCSYHLDKDLNHTTHIQAWVSYSYREGIGAYVSVYNHSFETLGFGRNTDVGGSISVSTRH